MKSSDASGNALFFSQQTCFAWGWDNARKQHHLAVRGMLPWQTTSSVVANAGRALSANQPDTPIQKFSRNEVSSV